MAYVMKRGSGFTGKAPFAQRSRKLALGIALATTASFGGMAVTQYAHAEEAPEHSMADFVRFVQAVLAYLRSIGVDVDALLAEWRSERDGGQPGGEDPSPQPTPESLEPEQVAALNNASRFLGQAAMGGDYQTISEVAQLGEAAWLEQQFATSPGYTMPLMDTWRERFDALYEGEEGFDDDEPEDPEEDELFDDDVDGDDEDPGFDEDLDEDQDFEEDDDAEDDEDDRGEEDDEESCEREDEDDREDSSESDDADDEDSDEDDESDEESERCEGDDPLEFEDFEGNASDYAWYQQVVNGPDPVRQRVATALSEIFVISRTAEEVAEHSGLRGSYYDMLLRHSFGNFRNLLLDVTLHPGMGIYLSHANNARSNPELGTFPDENYAREVMQLFTIGLYELNPDGSYRLGDNNAPVPTYDNDDIREFAKVFTGLTFNGPNPLFSNLPEPESREADFSLPMIMVEEYHEPGEKFLLNGMVVPAGQAGMQDIEAAVDNLFNHPNVGPFIGRQLIQRLVTSNPSPEYVARVSAAFNGESGSPRGDMKAVLRAILLDEEARQAPELNPSYAGRLREPMLRHIHILRAFGATSETGEVVGNAAIGEAIGQFLLSAPSVFNFFQPSFSPNGEVRDAGLVAPEFQITTTDSIVGITNMSDFMTFGEEVTFFDGGLSFLSRSYLQLDEEIALAGSASALVDRLNIVLTHGTLRQETRDVIIAAVEQLEDPRDRVYRAVFLITISPDYAISL